MDGKPKLGVSSCLLGEHVRYDGGHRRDRFITDELARFFDFVPVCPELEIGLPTPRPPLRLVGPSEAPRLVFVEGGEDVTDRMEAWARTRCGELEHENLCGYIFKSKSPSSGMERVKVYDPNGVPANTGVGVFARIFMAHFPLLPVEDEGRLHDAGFRENFIERVFAVRRWQELVEQGRTRGHLVEFHARHKLLIMSHSPRHLTELGQLVADANSYRPTDLYERYFARFVEALKLTATVPKQCNVLQHVMGFFKKQLADDEKKELIEVIEQYRRGHVPLIVPITLLNHYVRLYGPANRSVGDYLAQQHYLHPHPVELSLRSHI
jgi:uncharacterized protein YbgA (DUF1722 family)/uncharacterized protein YbbK (DUF523 family)